MGWICSSLLCLSPGSRASKTPSTSNQGNKASVHLLIQRDMINSLANRTMNLYHRFRYPKNIVNFPKDRYLMRINIISSTLSIRRSKRESSTTKLGGKAILKATIHGSLLKIFLRQVIPSKSLKKECN